MATRAGAGAGPGAGAGAGAGVSAGGTGGTRPVKRAPPASPTAAVPSAKRVPASVPPTTPPTSTLTITPLGAGNEVGRSCIILKFKGKTIMMDCGVLPSFYGERALPYLREIDPAEVDVVFITHFHLDHCASLPHFTERMKGFRGKIFATSATIAVMKIILADYVRVSNLNTEDELYSERDVTSCIRRITAVDFKQTISVDGMKFHFLHAGHVLGAAMVFLDIAGTRILYTGDYSCEEDRHLMAARPPVETPPDVLIVEATFGMKNHEEREDRENQFTSTVRSTLDRGGRVLIPVFALGRAQELLLILEEYWAANPSLHHIPIYFSSNLANKSLDVYRTYISHMNHRVQAQMAHHNPWVFKFISNLSRPDAFSDVGPSVVLASPGMLQSGFSRQLFDRWCEDARNTILLTGYSVEGTLARKLLTSPREVESMSMRKLALNATVKYVAFAAHADSVQTARFVEALQPPHIVLVHGEINEMSSLHRALSEKYESKAGFGVFMPANGESVQLEFLEHKVAQVIGSVAEGASEAGAPADGLLVHKDFEYKMLRAEDVSEHTHLTAHTLKQVLHVTYRNGFDLLEDFIRGMHDDVTRVRPDGDGDGADGTDDARRKGAAPAPVGGSWRGDGKPDDKIVVLDLVTVTHNPPRNVVLSWDASPQADFVADSLVALIAHADVSAASVRMRTACGHDHHKADAVAADDGASPTVVVTGVPPAATKAPEVS